MQFGKLLKFTIPAVLFLAITCQWFAAYTSVNGPDPGYTDAPSENGNCASCHSGSSVSSSSSTIKLKTQQSSTTLEYLPDSTYTITIDFSPSSASKYGFQTTALINSSGKMAGTFTITNSSTTQLKNTVINSNTRYYVEHTSGGTSSKSWSFTWKAPSSNVGDIVFYVAANAADGDNSRFGDKIYTNTFTFSPSSKLPTASISVPSTSVCVGDSLQFTGGGTNSPLTYKWTFTGATPSTSTLQNPKVLYKTVGNFIAKLSVTNAYGTSVEISRPISVKAIPADTISVNGSRIICEGDSVKLTAAAGSKFLWSTGETTSFIYAKKAGDYTVKVTNASNCTVSSKPVSITVHSKPIVTLSRTYGNDKICENDSLVLEAGTDTSIYTFYDDYTVVQNGTSASFTAKNLSAGTHIFYVIATDANGCKSDISAKYTTVVTNMLKAPVLNCGTPTTSSVTINWNAISGATGYEVSTDSGKTWISTTATSYTKTALQDNESIEIQVRATDNTVCKFGETATTICKTLPCSQLTYTINADSVICQGDSALIRFNNLSSPTYYIRVNGGAPTKQTVFFFHQKALDTTINIALYDSTKPNCAPIEHSFNIRMDKMPVLQLQTDKNVYCMGENIILGTTGGYNNYKFYRNRILVQTQKDTIFSYQNVKDGDTLYVIAETKNGCTAQSDEKTVAVAPRTNPGFTFTSDKLAVTFTDTTAQVTSRKWNFGDGATSTDINPTHTYSTAGQYTVWLITTNFQGCTDSVSKTLDVKTVGVQELYFLQEANIYPNPFQNEINISVYSKQASKIQITVTDIRGKTLINMPLQTKQGRNEIAIPANHFPGGIYMLKIQTGSEILTKKIMKVKER